MTRPRQARLVHIAVRCYSPKWRERHADEATELAELLMRDGMSAVFIALSYLKAATRDRLVTRPKRRLGPTAAVLLIGATLVGVPLVLLDSFTAANAASSNESFVVVLSGHNAVGHLESVFRSHHFNIKVEGESSSPSQIGAVLAVKADGGEHGTLTVIRRSCAASVSGYIDALVVPLHYTGMAQVIVGCGPKPCEAALAPANAQGNRRLQPPVISVRGAFEH